MTQFISTEEAAAICGFSTVALWKRRQKGQPPKAHPSASGKRFFYDKAEVLAFARDRDRFRQLENRIRDLERAVVALESKS